MPRSFLSCLDGRHYVEVNVEILNNCFMASLLIQHALTVTQCNGSWNAPNDRNTAIMEPFARHMKSAWCQILDNDLIPWVGAEIDQASQLIAE